MRVRIALGLAVAVVAGALVLDMSRSAPRTAGSDHDSPAMFAASLPRGGSVCQPVPSLPRDAARASLTIGTYGKPVPALYLRFLDAGGAVTAEGRLPAGAHQGVVTLPLHDRSNPERSTSACLVVTGTEPVAIAGEGVPVTAYSELIDGERAAGRISLMYYRGGRETWWQLLPVLAERFAFGKAPFFGSWLLPFAALALLFVWVGSIRLLSRELRSADSR